VLLSTIKGPFSVVYAWFFCCLLLSTIKAENVCDETARVRRCNKSNLNSQIDKHNPVVGAANTQREAAYSMHQQS